MSIKFKLALQFTILTGILLVFFTALVYYFFYDSQLYKFRSNLKNSAQNTAVLLINVAEVDSALLKKIQRSTSSWEKEEIIITDSAFNVIYSNQADYLDETNIRKHHSGSETSYFTLNEKDGVFLRHYYNSRTYYVYAAAFDKTRKENLSQLIEVLIWSVIISLILAVYLSYFFSKKAMLPISKLIDSIRSINSSKLSQRLDEGNKKDEIAQLSITFNEMLTDLEKSFKNQEDFISNASHELRTPLTVMMVESDYMLTKDLTSDEYKEHLSRLIEDIRKLNTMLTSLLELAHLNKEKAILFSQIRLDEIVYNSILEVKSKYKDRKIIPRIPYPENEGGLIIKGNSELLLIAFKNLIENACKFSQKEVYIQFNLTPQLIEVTITDEGIGIPAEQISEVFGPFKRASNVTYKGGYGIGLYLVARILEIHKVPIEINSSEDQGTTMKLTFHKN